MIISVFDRVENIVGKGEIACTRNFSYSQNDSKRLSSQQRPKMSLLWEWVKRVFLLTFPKRQILDTSKQIEFADDNLKLNEHGRKFSKRVENIVGKGEIARNELFLLFPQCFQKASTAHT